MINQQLTEPKSIIVVGGSDNIRKPGGKVIRNLIEGNYEGKLYAVNPKEKEVQGIKCFESIESAPEADMAIIAIPAPVCPQAVEILARDKNVKAFIILSAGFSEETHEGKILEDKIRETCDKYGASLIGPNCIGVMNRFYHGVFTLPIPEFKPEGSDRISSSGTTVVYILDSSVLKGLTFTSLLRSVVKHFPAIKTCSQICPLHPALHPHVEVPAKKM